MAFAPEVFFQVGRFPVTNTVINTVLVDGFLLLLAYYTAKNIKLIPGKFQSIMELIIGGFHNFVESVAGEKTKKIFPYFMTFFIFIVIANWSGLIPGVTTFGLEKTEVHDGHEEHHIVPFIRPLTSDINATFALALISLIATHLLAIREVGLKEYLSRFFAFIPFLVSLAKGKPKINLNFKDPLSVVIGVITPLVMVFVGLLELVSEFVKAISLSFRLFGNIYAGEVVLETVHGLFAFLFPLPFLLLELIVGIVQGLVFAMLTMVFMVILSSKHSEEAH
jgi:F-type H+-transporting ATPase subunit a